MKCEHCGNDMHWKGSIQGGRMACEHCANDDRRIAIPLLMTEDAAIAIYSDGITWVDAERQLEKIDAELNP